jgi:hypothetical protein
MNTCGGVELHSFLTSTVVSTKFTPGERIPYTPEWVWTFREAKQLFHCRDFNLDPPARSLDTILTELSQLFLNMFRYKSKVATGLSA